MKFRAIRPSTEDLEGRNLLSGIVSGVDTQGDAWTLRVVGPGSIHVIKQPNSAGNGTALTANTEIESITIAGTDPLHTRLIGNIKTAPGGDGKVFFQNFTEVANRRENGGGGNGLLSIDMPGFWLGLTAATAPTSTTGTEPSISIPDGTATLRFGGVDTTAFFGTDPTKSLANNNQSDTLRVNLGVPQYGGTRVVIDKSIANSVAGTTSSTGTQGNPTHDGVDFSVLGRLGIFQANEVVDNKAFPLGFFQSQGGTNVSAANDTTLGVAGTIGEIRVGTNATNFQVTSVDKIHQSFIGGETTNVSILAVNGSRNLLFGKGMDQTKILSHTIESLQANRGAIGSTVIVDRQIGSIQFGGDVVDTTIEAGYDQQLATAFNNPASAPTPSPQVGGQIRVTVAGNVTNSVFASSYAPDSKGDFGTPDSFALPFGTIKGRIEGTIDNAIRTPDSPKTAFYAQKVILTKGAVVPPNVPEAPFQGPLTPRSLPGVPNPYYRFKKK
jgi:hypothetical protein